MNMIVQYVCRVLAHTFVVVVVVDQHIILHCFETYTHRSVLVVRLMFSYEDDNSMCLQCPARHQSL